MNALRLTPLEHAVLIQVQNGDPYAPCVSRNGIKQIGAALGRLKDKGALTVEVQADGALEYQLTGAGQAALEADR